MILRLNLEVNRAELAESSFVQQARAQQFSINLS